MKLTQVTKILDISPIPKADRIERAKVLGWDCVVQKGLHQVGDTVIFVFPDTLVPKKFLDSTYEGDEKVRLKTVKMRGQFSAGLILPLKVLPYDGLLSNITTEFQDGCDVASFIGVEKYEKPLPIQLTGQMAGGFPEFLVSKTDEDNYKSNPEGLEELRSLVGEEVVVTTKADGCSATYLVDPEDNKFKICSRNYELIYSETNTFCKISEKYFIENLIRSTGRNLAIQGEIVGPKIQDNPMGFSEHHLLVFLIKDLDTGNWFSWDETVQFCNGLIPTVEEVCRFKAEEIPSDEDLQKMADNHKYNDKVNAEGLVIRTVKPISSNTLNKTWISLKVISNPYDAEK